LGRPGLRLSAGAATALTHNPWRGNVRELANALERAAILADSDEVTAADLGGSPLAPLTSSAAPAATHEGTLEEIEREAIRAALAAMDGHRRKAAERLGIGERTLYDKLKRYGMG